LMRHWTAIAEQREARQPNAPFKHQETQPHNTRGRTMRHKYLNAIGIASDNPCVFNTRAIDASSERQARFEHERDEYGFDSRETWSLDYTLATWLFEHLSWYRDNAPIDMTFYDFDVPAWDEQTASMSKTETVNLTQAQCIDTILDNLEFAIKNDGTATLKTEAEAHERMSYALRILSESISVMWW
jgi:hypothetical protein